MAKRALIVLPDPPFITSASPLARLPIGTYAVKVDRGSRLSKRTKSSGTSTIRSDRLALAGLHRRPKQTRHVGLWRGVALDHLDAFARLQGRKVGRRGFDFGVSHR